MLFASGRMLFAPACLEQGNVDGMMMKIIYLQGMIFQVYGMSHGRKIVCLQGCLGRRAYL